ncbi:thioesterase family protein [Burkholderiaceae bacterium DAT-1]|nr:thioesterase family protein [Burkholderiaceae bacterium DAT-1]
MARVRIDLPQSFDFSTELDVTIAHINYGKHLGNDAAFTLLHDARLHFFRALGYEDELNFHGLGLIQADAAVVYKRQAFWGDRLKFELASCEFSRAGFELHYRVSHATQHHEILQAKIGLVFFNYETQKPAPIPEPFIHALRQMNPDREFV